MVRFILPPGPRPVATVQTYRSLNLLAHGQLAELDLGSLCGGHGVCGRDRIRVQCDPGQVSPVSAVERRHLSAEEIDAGFRLGCQCYPQSDDAHIDIVLTADQ